MPVSRNRNRLTTSVLVFFLFFSIFLISASYRMLGLTVRERQQKNTECLAASYPFSRLYKLFLSVPSSLLRASAENPEGYQAFRSKFHLLTTQDKYRQRVLNQGQQLQISRKREFSHEEWENSNRFENFFPQCFLGK